MSSDSAAIPGTQSSFDDRNIEEIEKILHQAVLSGEDREIVSEN